MRQLGPPKKKVRGVPRRLRQLARWSASLSGDSTLFEREENEPYNNLKIPVFSTLVQGRHATQSVRRTCVQLLIDGCRNLIESRPQHLADSRVVAAICLPDLFVSEICVYFDGAYFRRQTQPSEDGWCVKTLISGRLLSHEWRLVRPPQVNELGLAVTDLDDDDFAYHSQVWYFGDV